MKPPRRLPALVRLALAAAALAGALLSACGRDSRPGSEDDAPPAAEAPAKEARADSASEEAWKKAHPWLFRDTAAARFREDLILPLARAHGLGPRQLRGRSGNVELTFPRGRPMHEYAWEVEVRARRAGTKVVEGRELGLAADQAEYLLEDEQGAALTLRISMGKGAVPGAVRMALVVVGLGAGDSALREWLAFPEAVTLTVPDTVRLPGKGGPVPGRLDILVELPMEPAAYPYVKPGPRAVFIHHSREETERILRGRLQKHPRAAGFATLHGDRAIENGPLMENVLAFTRERSLLFLDLTGSPRSLTSAVSLRTGAEAFTARVQAPGSEEALRAELARRTDLAKRAGEGIWVLRHDPGLPGRLARLIGQRSAEFEEAGLQWVTLRELRRESGN